MADQKFVNPPTPSDDMGNVLQTRVNARLEAASTPVNPAIWTAALQAIIQFLQACLAARQTTTPTTTPVVIPTAAESDVATAMANPTVFQRVALHRAMVTQIGRQAFRQNGEALHANVLAVSMEASQAERVAFVVQAAATPL